MSIPEVQRDSVSGRNGILGFGDLQDFEYLGQRTGSCLGVQRASGYLGAYRDSGYRGFWRFQTLRTHRIVDVGEGEDSGYGRPRRFWEFKIWGFWKKCGIFGLCKGDLGFGG